MYKNNKILTSPLPIKKINSKVYIPARFFSDYLNYNMKYDSPTINYGKTIRFLPVIFMQDNTSENISVVKNFLYSTAKIIPFNKMNIKNDENFINNNFPEQIPSNSFYETFINKSSQISGKVRYFASHANRAKEKINYIIRLENKGFVPATIKFAYDSDTEEKTLYLQEMERVQLKRFYDNKIKNEMETFILKQNESKDFVIKDISVQQFFSAIMDLQIEGTIEITSFVVPSKDKAPSTSHKTPSVVYDYNYKPKTFVAAPIEKNEMNYTTYSGKGQGFQIFGENTIKASQLNGQVIGFETGQTDKNINEINGLDEIIDIKLLEPRGKNNEITKATWVLNLPYIEEHEIWLRDRARNYGNLGNWNAEYNITTKLVNDTDSGKIFYLHLLSEFQAVIGFGMNNNFQVKGIDNELHYDKINRKDLDGSAQINIYDESKLWKMIAVNYNSVYISYGSLNNK